MRPWPQGMRQPPSRTAARLAVHRPHHVHPAEAPRLPTDRADPPEVAGRRDKPW